MDGPSQRWLLLGTSTNDSGVKHFTVSRRGDNPGDQDYSELLSVLRNHFACTDDGELRGPYSVHRFMKVNGLRFGIVLNSPDWLDLYATEKSQNSQMTSFVTLLLKTLNDSQN